jgi:hypothetical protein
LSEVKIGSDINHDVNVNVSHNGSSMWCIVVGPRVVTWVDHMSSGECATCYVDLAYLDEIQGKS